MGIKSETKKYPSVIVKWLDSCEPVPNSEVMLPDIPLPQVIFQCGFLILDKEDYISVAGAIKPENGDCFDYVITIPKFAILEMVTIK